MTNDEIPVELRLSLKEVNVILEGLYDRPFREVVDLINKVHQQAQEQVNAPTPATERERPVSNDTD